MARLCARPGVALMALAMLACGEQPPTSPPIEQRVVVHAVLDPQNAQQVILVERTLDGQVGSPPPGGANPLDPIVTSGGIPISDARVVIIGPGTDSIVAVEDRTSRADGLGAGVYRIPSRAVATEATTAPDGVLRIAPGAQYELRVESALGTVHGTTWVPRFNATIDRALRRFNLDTDTLWRTDVTGTGVPPGGYLLRHEMTGVVNRSRLLADSTPVLLAPAPLGDDMTWSFGFSRKYIRPGGPQRFRVFAVDSNYYDYSAGGYDPFGHDAKGNRLEGGVGLFGAVAAIADANLDLIANRDHPIEGLWASTTGAATLPVEVRLYESPRFPGPVADAPGTALHLWGTARMTNGTTQIADASFAGSALQLQLSPPGSSQVTRVTGTFDGTTLTLVAGAGVSVRYENRTP